MTLVQANTTWYQTQFVARCLTKDETYESYSPWKGHCFAQLPSAGAAWGVESQIDKSEMTLKQRQDGCRLFVCPFDKVGVEETQSRAVLLVLLTIAVKMTKQRKRKKRRGMKEKTRRSWQDLLSYACKCTYSLHPFPHLCLLVEAGPQSFALCSAWGGNCFLFIMSCCI